jgi:hypothetical protein
MHNPARNAGTVGLAAASVMVMLATIAAIAVPYLDSELRKAK